VPSANSPPPKHSGGTALKPKTTAALAQTIAHYSITTAQRLLSNSHRFAIAPAVAEPENAIASTINPAVLENAIAPSEAQTIAPTIAPEPELDDSESDHIAIDEPEQAMLTLQESASTEPQQAIALSEAEAIEPEPNFGEAIADDGDAALSVGTVPLDDDDTELRYWAELELPSILDEEYSHLVVNTDDSAAGAEAED
jgi:hypothetical protein